MAEACAGWGRGHGGGLAEWFANSEQTSFTCCIRVNESFTRVWRIFFSKAANGKLIIKIPGTKFKDTPANAAT